MMHYNTGKRSIRYTGTPPGRPRPVPPPGPMVPHESPYYSPAYPYSLARRHSEGVQPPERTYESLHILDRPIPEEQELGEAEPLTGNYQQAQTLPLPPTSRNRRLDHDIYNTSIASTSSHDPAAKDPKYYVLDRNFIQSGNALHLDDD